MHREGEYLPKLGDFLGDFTDEINPKEGNYIKEFVSGGPKNYAYKLDTGITDCVVKGYAINHLTNLLLNFDSIKECVDDSKKEIQIPQLKFIKNKSNWQIETQIKDKKYNCLTYNKRVLLSDGKTLPYGYNQKNNNLF